MAVFKKKSYVGEISNNRLYESDSSNGNPTNYNARLVSPINFDSSFTNNDNIEYELLNKWRSMVKNPYIAFAINDIVNEMNIFFNDSYKYQVKIDMSESKYSDFLKKKISEEWEYLLDTISMENKLYSYLKDWYIDGILYWKLDLEEGKGVKSIEKLDPIFLKKDIDIESGKEYYIYNQMNEDKNKTKAALLYGKSDVEYNIGIPEDSVIYCDSGIYNEDNTVALSFLDSAYVSLNQLTSIEDSLLVYRIARAPARRVFYIDTGMLPKSKAEAYMREVARNYKQEINYDPSTGKFSEQNVHLSLLDDLFLPRSGDSQRTEVSQLEGNSSFAESLKDLDYFRKKLFRALLIPFNRWGGQEDGNDVKSYASAAEITRDELKYSKYIQSLRSNFNNMFYRLLERHLLVKHLTNKDTFDEYKSGIKFLWAEDSSYQERGNLDILSQRLDILGTLQEFIESGYFSKDWCKKNILKMTDEDIRQIEKENKEDNSDVAEGDFEGGYEGGSGGGEDSFSDIESMSAESAPSSAESPAEESISGEDKVLVEPSIPIENNTLASVEEYLNNIEAEKDLNQENYNNISRVQHNKLVGRDE